MLGSSSLFETSLPGFVAMGIAVVGLKVFLSYHVTSRDRRVV